MSRERKNNKESKKKPMTSLKEKRAAKRAKHAAKTTVMVF